MTSTGTTYPRPDHADSCEVCDDEQDRGDLFWHEGRLTCDGCQNNVTNVTPNATNTR